MGDSPNPKKGMSAGQVITIIILIGLMIVAWALLFYFRGSNRELPEYERTTQQEIVVEDTVTEDVAEEDVIDSNANKGTNTNSANTNTNKPSKKDEAVTTKKLVNEDIGIQLHYPDIFTNGVKSSKKGSIIQIYTYDPSDVIPTDNFDEFPGIKVEIVKEANDGGLTLLEYATQFDEIAGPTYSLDELTVDGRDALRDYTQYSNFTNSAITIDEGDEFYIFNVVANNEDYEQYEALLDDMIDSIELDI